MGGACLLLLEGHKRHTVIMLSSSSANCLSLSYSYWCLQIIVAVTGMSLTD
jgi:hypothetical protein